MNTSGSSGERIPRLALDTSAYSKLRGGDTRVRDLIADAESVLVPSPVLGELHGAFELGSRTRENRVALSDFLSEPFVQIIPVTEAVARGSYVGARMPMRRQYALTPANSSR